MVNGRLGAPSLPSDQDFSGRSLGPEELDLLTQAVKRGTLFAPKGRYVKELESSFAEWVGVESAIACSSGTAAIHAAVAAIDPEPGEEIVTTPITDIGALTPILYQGAIPVFADVDSETGNITAASVADRISERTRAIVVTHLFGNPADVEAISAIAETRQIPIIEDCAQAFGARVDRQLVGSSGAVAAFSLQQGKHITTGEGGLVATSDPVMAKRMRLFVNKAWDYNDPSDHDFLALNYRMSELQGAVGVAQIAKLTDSIESRRTNAEFLDKALVGVQGIEPIRTTGKAEPSYWRYCLMIDEVAVPGGPDALAVKLRDLGVPSAPRYIKKPAFQTGLFVNQKTFGSSGWPFSQARPEAMNYDETRFPGTFEFLRRVLVLPWNERMRERDVDLIAAAIESAVAKLRMEGK